MNERTSETFNRFVELLKGIFELDKADLDFGIYRVMNIRKTQIEEFLARDLPKKVNGALENFTEDTSALLEQIAEIEKKCDDVGVEVSKSKMAEEYKRIKDILERRKDRLGIETSVYSALYSFFSRYYDEGDFISKRRYKDGVYAIPYEGEEVKLHWANADQYYIKTSVNFRDYTFIVDGKKVNFRLVDATCEKNNNKESNENKRAFILCEENPIEKNDDSLTINFIYDINGEKQPKHSEDAFKTITDFCMKEPEWYGLIAPVSATLKDGTSPLAKHLKAYVAKNNFDYFIHKDLKGFLTRELDFFIKSEVLFLDELDTPDEKKAENYLAKIRAIKRVGKIIIDFLAQIEEFQKKLWLKKKFVVDTNWCVTLDHIGEEFYPEIIANDAQIAEWKAMYAIDEITGDLTAVAYSQPLSAEFLRQNGNLVVDTWHFTADFKDRLIASIDNLDEQTGGLMVHSENFQALRLLTERYRGRIDGIYIDPPYNTNSSPILYKNGYRDASWISLLENRIKYARQFMTEKAFNAITIDYLEAFNLGEITDDIYGRENRVGIVTVFINPKGRQHEKYFASSTEYMYVYANKLGAGQFNSVTIDDDKAATFDMEDDNGKYRLDPFARIRSNTLREIKPDAFYPIYVSKDLTDITLDEIKGYTAVYPTVNGIDYSWKVIATSFDDDYNDGGEIVAIEENGEIKIYNKYYEKQVFHNLWTDKKYFPEFQGTNLLKKMLGKKLFSYPKSLYAVMDTIKIISPCDATIMDYFSGSGTTGSAVIELNRLSDIPKRKYILVEMGDYFNTVVLPRIKKSIYATATDWKAGKPQSRDTGVSHIMKYFTLESYEDALSNIELDDNMHEELSKLGDEYMLNYMLRFESRDSLLRTDDFRDPWGYKLKINTNNQTEETAVDLMETFNYLLGLSVIRQSKVQRFDAAVDNKEYEGSVSLTSGSEFAFKQYEGILPDDRKALIIWRTVTDDILRSNAALDAYFLKHRINPADREFDFIYVNCDNNLENLKTDEEEWKVQRIEPLFKEKMFEEDK